MKILELIPTYDAARMGALEQNAKRQLEKGTEKQKADAELVLFAISADRKLRRESTDKKIQDRRTQIAAEIQDKGLFDRVVYCFTAEPAAEWEAELLTVIAQNPGIDFNILATKINKRGGPYINLAMGNLCRDREHYLGEATASATQQGEKFYAGLLVDLQPHKDHGGRKWHSWHLKPDVEAALKQAGTIS